MSVLVSGAIQVAWTAYALRVARPLFTWRDATVWASVRGTLTQAGPMMLGLGVLQINTAVDGLIASWPTYVGPTIFGFAYPLTEGAMSSITYAQRLYEFPLGVFGISIATAVFPLLAKQNNDAVAFAGTIRRALRLSVFIGLHASAGLMLASRESVGALFQRGNFTAEDTERVAWVLIGFAPAIWSYQMGHIFTRAFYARKEAMTPVLVAVAMVILNVCLNLTLIFTPLREAGLAWSTAICSILQSAILLRILARRVPDSLNSEVVGGWMRCALATAVMTAVTLAVGAFLPESSEWGTLAIHLAIKVAVAEDGARQDKVLFEAEFKRLSKSEAENVGKNFAGFALDVLKGWRGLTDSNGKDIPYSPDNAAALIEANVGLEGILTEFFVESFPLIKAKN
jgi:putative peptidoglycan lipid II flippase